MVSRLDKAKAERERLQREAEEYRTLLSETEQKLIAIGDRLQKIDVFITEWDYFGEDDTSANGDAALNRTATEASASITSNSPFYGMGQPGAATLLLQMEGREMRTAEITRRLQQEGFEFATKDPVRAVDWALKRAAELGHVIKVARAVWVVSPTANPADFKETEARSSRTRAGLEVARRRGVRLGTPPKLTEDHHRLAVALFEQGETVTQIAKQCGVTVTGLRNRITQWRNEGRFPAPRPRKRRAQPEQDDHERGMVH